jgi:hypothetical protein
MLLDYNLELELVLEMLLDYNLELELVLLAY